MVLSPVSLTLFSICFQQRIPAWYWWTARAIKPTLGVSRTQPSMSEMIPLRLTDGRTEKRSGCTPGIPHVSSFPERPEENPCATAKNRYLRAWEPKIDTYLLAAKKFLELFASPPDLLQYREIRTQS